MVPTRRPFTWSGDRLVMSARTMRATTPGDDRYAERERPPDSQRETAAQLGRPSPSSRHLLQGCCQQDRTNPDWGGWIRTTDLPINSRTLCHSATPHRQARIQNAIMGNISSLSPDVEPSRHLIPAAMAPIRIGDGALQPSAQMATRDQPLDGTMKVVAVPDNPALSRSSGQPPHPPSPRASPVRVRPGRR